VNSLIPHFPFLDGGGVDAVYNYVLGRYPTHAQHLFLRNNGNDPWLTNGVCAFTPPDYRKKTLLVYACCHGAQLCEYWLNHSSTRYIRDNFNIIFWQNYRTQGDAHYMPGQASRLSLLPDEYRELFIASFRKADVVVTHPAYGGTEFDPNHLISSYAKPSVTHIIKFHSPSFGALWPVCLYGDDWCKDLLVSGLSADQIKERLANGELHCNLSARFAQALTRMRHKDTLVDVGISRFFSAHFRTHRMFVTFNHPSFHLMASQALRIEESLAGQHPGIIHSLSPTEEAYCLALPWNSCNFQPVWPDHRISNRELGLRYTDSYPDTTGTFYGGQIERCAAEVIKAQQ
jgi:hypothetical protein